MGKAQQRVGRLFDIVALVQSRDGVHADELAERFGVSVTRIFNDIRALREVGVPIRRTGEGYKMGSGFFLPPLDLTDREVASLFFPTELLAPSHEDRTTQRAREKLLSCLSDGARRRVRHLLHHTAITVPPDGTKRWILEELRTALLEQRRLLVIHPSHPQRLGARFEFDTYGLAYHKGTWRAVGYSVPHGEVRTLRVSDIAAVEPTPLHFALPEDFSLQEHLH